MAKLKIGDLLRGCTPHRMQSVGFMQVIPLTSDLHDDRFVSPNQGARVSTSGYGNLQFENPVEKPMIVPAHATYIVDQKAQNHAMPSAGLVKARAIKMYHEAMCVQQSQGGHISSGQHQMVILPFALRGTAYKVRKDVGFQKLWPAITEFNRANGITKSGGHLEYFFEQFKDQLDSFVAQFEPVPDQVGAIVLIGGKIVGIERTPSPAYFESIWSALIRECYGSMAITEARSGGVPPVPRTRVPLRKVVSFSDLQVALQSAVDEEYNRVSALVNSVTSVEVDRTVDETDGEMVREYLGDQPFLGSLVRDGEKIVYASLVSTDQWRRNEDWHTATPFSMPRRPVGAR